MRKTLFCLLISFCIKVGAIDIYVSPKGKDDNPGDGNNTKATLYSALKQARELRRNSNITDESITIHIKDGLYQLYQPVYIRPEDSGTDKRPLVIKADNHAVISGGIRISNWKKNDKVWVADVPDFNGRPIDFRQLWVNGEKAVRARDVDDFNKMNSILGIDVENQILWVPAKSVKKILNSKYAELVILQRWEIANLRIKTIDLKGDRAAVKFHNPESDMEFTHPWPSPDCKKDYASVFYLTNAKELLDIQGEWYHDIETKKLYYMPKDGEDMTKAEIIVPAVETLISVLGTIDNPVKNIKFENIDFSYTTWMAPSIKGHVPLQAGMNMIEAYRFSPKMYRGYDNSPLDNQAWLIRDPAAVEIRYAENIDFEKCNFKHLAHTGLDYIIATHGGSVLACNFKDIGGTGIQVGTYTPAGQETHQAYDPADKREICSNQLIKNCLVTDVANEDWGCIGISAGLVRDIRIENNEIYDVPYSAISLGWAWTKSINCMRNNIVKGNVIHHFARQLEDTGGIYTLGAQPKSSVIGNVIYSPYTTEYKIGPTGVFYLYADEGSSFITFKDNWTEKERFGKHKNVGNVWENNGPQVADSIKNNAGIKNK